MLTKREKGKFIKTKDWIWLPHPAHLIVSRRCQFRLSTVVGDFIISTIGEFYRTPDSDMEEIGCDRFYETMVFLKKSIPESVCESCRFSPTGDCIDFKGYNVSRDAMEGHMYFCRKYSRIKYKNKCCCI